LTAAIGVLLVIVLIVGPVTLLVHNLGQQVVAVAGLVQSGAAQDWLTGTIDRIPWLNDLVDQAMSALNLRQAVQGTAGYIATWMRGLLAGSVSTLTQLVLMLFTLFFLFRDRRDAAKAFRSLLPLDEFQRDRLIERMSNTIEATLQGSLTIAAIQGALGGIMFWVLGVPAALVWALVMAVLATIPSLGTFLVWMPVAVYLALTGHWVKAGILVGWGTFVIGTVDNLLYPTLVGTKIQMHTVPVLFAVLGGIALFGISGVVLGPLVLTTAVTLLRFWSPKALPQSEDDPASRS
jgi:predicted PurR-regulated permease PerM